MQKKLLLFFLHSLFLQTICAMDAEPMHNIACVKASIAEMFDADQALRKQFLQDRHNQTLIEKILALDRVHTMQMKRIIATHGWPTISKFGVCADAQAWLLVQHADHDPIFQKGCFDLLQSLIATHDTNPQNYAYLYDRVVVAYGMGQMYGTQCRVSDCGDVFLQPYDGTIQDLNERRQLLGLMPIEAYMQQMRAAYKKPAYKK